MQPATEAAALECVGKPRVDLTGRKFGKLTVVGFAGRKRTDKGMTMMWACLCECGVAKPVAYPALIQGRATQCMNCKNASHHWRSHGLSEHPLYRTWYQMILRCDDETCPAYKNYGGRGIQVCSRWKASFEAFLEDMGDKPTPEHSIDRINNDGNYEPSNCRWATQKEQCQNTRWARPIEFNGETLTVTQWAARLGITRERLRQRLQTRSVEEALSCKKNETSPRLAANSAAYVSRGRSKLDWIPADWLDGKVRRIDRGADFAPPAENVAGMIRERAGAEGGKAVTRIIDDTILFKFIKKTT